MKVYTDIKPPVTKKSRTAIGAIIDAMAVDSYTIVSAEELHNMRQGLYQRGFKPVQQKITEGKDAGKWRIWKTTR